MTEETRRITVEHEKSCKDLITRAYPCGCGADETWLRRANILKMVEVAGIEPDVFRIQSMLELRKTHYTLDAIEREVAALVETGWIVGDAWTGPCEACGQQRTGPTHYRIADGGNEDAPK